MAKMNISKQAKIEDNELEDNDDDEEEEEEEEDVASVGKLGTRQFVDSVMLMNRPITASRKEVPKPPLITTSGGSSTINSSVELSCITMGASQGTLNVEGDNEEKPEDTTESSSATETTTKQSDRSVTSHGSDVRFDRVCIHQHRMTLGDNPVPSLGVPVTLAWDVEESQRFNIETYESEKLNRSQASSLNAGMKGGAATNASTTTGTTTDTSTSDSSSGRRIVGKILKRDRLKIALRNHTRSSIARVNDEILDIQVSRKKNETEDPDVAMMEEERQRKKQEWQKRHPVLSRFFGFRKRQQQQQQRRHGRSSAATTTKT